MKKLILLFTTIVFIVSSCSKKESAADRIVTKESIKQDLADIIKENPDIDSSKIELVLSYLYITNGREAYLDSLVKGNESKRDFFSSFLVDEEEFERQVGNIFASFKNDKFTYRTWFNQIDSIEAYTIRYQKEYLDELYNEVEEECQRRQQISAFIANATSEQKDSILHTEADLSYLAEGRDTVIIEDLNSALDYKYETPDELFGFCPYMNNREPIAAKIRKARTERDNYIKEHFTISKKYTDNYSKLFK